MKKNNDFLKRNDSWLTPVLWAIIALLISLFASREANGAVTVTSAGSPSVSGSHGRLDLMIGDKNEGDRPEASLIGATTSTAQYEWQLLDGIGAQESNTTVFLTLGLTSMSAQLNGADGVRNLTPVNYSVNPGAINTLHIFLSSSASTGNTMSMESITLAQAGLGTQPIGDLSVSGSGDTEGIKVEFTGGSGDIQLSFNQVFSRTEGPFNTGFANEQTVRIVTSHNPAIPEPSSVAMLLIAAVGAFRRNR